MIDKMNAKQTASFLGISWRTFQILRKKWDVHGIQFGTRIYYLPEDVRAWIDRQRNEINEK